MCRRYNLTMLKREVVVSKNVYAGTPLRKSYGHLLVGDILLTIL